MTQQKLYTEEQVVSMLDRARMHKQDDTEMFTNEYLLSQATPIELPSDDEMAIFALNISETLRDKLNGEQEAFFIAGFIESNKWMRDKILDK